MIYLSSFLLPNREIDDDIIDKRTYVTTYYPFKIFPYKELDRLDFSTITILYGSNGSGKSTLINVIASKLNATRFCEFNDAPLFNKFVEFCSADFIKVPKQSYVLTSDDVFDYVLSARNVNDNLWERRNELTDKYSDVYMDVVYGGNIDAMRLKSMDDYDRYSETVEILSRRKTQSSYVKNRVARDIDLHSNGETAKLYFIKRIEEDALYFLDEPENSLSIESQIDLAEFITATARATRSQFIIATHSPIFLSMKNAKIYNLDVVPVSVCKWTQLPNVRKYFEFFMDRKEEFQK